MNILPPDHTEINHSKVNSFSDILCIYQLSLVAKLHTCPWSCFTISYCPALCSLPRGLPRLSPRSPACPAQTFPCQIAFHMWAGHILPAKPPSQTVLHGCTFGLSPPVGGCGQRSHEHVCLGIVHTCYKFYRAHSCMKPLLCVWGWGGDFLFVCFGF